MVSMEVGGLLQTSRWDLINSVRGNGNGANILSSRYTGLVFALDMDDFEKYLLYGFIKNYTGNGSDYGISKAAKTIVLAANGLSLGATNVMGTQVINGGTNVQQFMIGLGG